MWKVMGRVNAISMEPVRPGIAPTTIPEKTPSRISAIWMKVKVPRIPSIIGHATLERTREPDDEESGEHEKQQA